MFTSMQERKDDDDDCKSIKLGSRLNILWEISTP
jgi:hypothetical protein